MAFRYRRRIRLFPGLTLNLSKNGLSSISLGGRGLSHNIPIARKGPAKTTVGIPGTGLSWSENHNDTQPGTPSKGFAPSQPSMADVLEEALVIHSECWLGPDGMGQLFWHEHGMGLCAYLKDREDTPARIRNAIEMCCSWDRIELILRRAPDPESIAQLSKAIIAAGQEVYAYATDKGICQEEG